MILRKFFHSAPNVHLHIEIGKSSKVYFCAYANGSYLDLEILGGCAHPPPAHNHLVTLMAHSQVSAPTVMKNSFLFHLKSSFRSEDI